MQWLLAKQKKIDVALIADKASELQNDLRHFNAIKTKCDNIETANEEIRKILGIISRKMEGELNQIISAINSG